MKTSKQLSEMVMEKIARQEQARLQFRKCARKAAAIAIVLCFLLPAGVYFSITEELNHEFPLSMPFEQDHNRPFDPDEPASNSPQTRNERDVEITLL